MKEMNFIKLHDEPASGIIYQWWKGLDQDRGGRAELRRCHNLTEVMFCPSFHRLYHSLAAVGAVNREGIALIAGVLSHVKKPHDQGKLGKLMADKRSGNTSRVSEPRFRRLIRITDRDELFQPFIRIIALLDGSVDVKEVSEILYYWNERVRKNLAFAYYEDEVQRITQ